MFVALGLLLLVKETLAVFVVFFGLYLVLRRRWREGLVAVLVGAAWYLVATKLLIPLFADGRDFRHWSYRNSATASPTLSSRSSRIPPSRSSSRSTDR